jgi:hypothetical protein
VTRRTVLISSAPLSLELTRSQKAAITRFMQRKSTCICGVSLNSKDPKALLVEPKSKRSRIEPGTLATWAICAECVAALTSVIDERRK